MTHLTCIFGTIAETVYRIDDPDNIVTTSGAMP